MQKLADYIGLPCRIARGCKYCVADHRSSCLVKIEDDRQSTRLDILTVSVGHVSCISNFEDFLGTQTSHDMIHHFNYLQNIVCVKSILRAL